ncbi:MAG: hypothetical protein ABEJ31_05830 [Haloarculaceae archaeon]
MTTSDTTDTTSDDRLRDTFREIEDGGETWAEVADPLNDDAWIRSTRTDDLAP